MKLSDLGQYVLIFVDGDQIIHKVVYTELPNIGTIQENFEEMKNDKDFGIGEDYLKLGVEIIYIDEYIKCYGDEELVI